MGRFQRAPVKKPWSGICIIVPSCDTRKRVITIIVSTWAMVKAGGGRHGPRGLNRDNGRESARDHRNGKRPDPFYDRSNRTIERLRFCISTVDPADHCPPPRCCNSTRRDCNSEREIATRSLRKERNEIKLHRFFFPPLPANCLLIADGSSLTNFTRRNY